MKVTYFPFDTQQCSMIFRSWTYDKYDISLHLSRDQATTGRNYEESGEWRILEIPGYLATNRRNENQEHITYRFLNLLQVL